ncbi:MAG TPA: hypothetical protein VKK31_25775 [Thermoanaerobaculia bacterium]|nr:hypothetical protein [Thermoanaerobaculia bacterium]
MHRATCRAVAVFLLALVLALPVAALPAHQRAAPRASVWTALWARLAPVFGFFEKSRASADPNGLTPPAPPADDNDSRSSMDPNG